MSIWRWAAAAALSVPASGCGTVDPGANFQFAEIVFDQNFFYCKVEPMLFQAKCGPGDPGTDGNSGCHFNVTTFRLTAHPTDPPVLVHCNGTVPTDPTVPPESQNNYQAAAREMSPDPDRAPLFNRPTQRAAHPRRILDPNGPEASLIRQWATRYTSQ